VSGVIMYSWNIFSISSLVRGSNIWKALRQLDR
jgi:hypothetical protein